MQVIAEEARDSYKEEIVKVLPSSTVDEMDANIENIVSWVQQYRAAHLR